MGFFNFFRPKKTPKNKNNIPKEYKFNSTNQTNNVNQVNNKSNVRNILYSIIVKGSFENILKNKDDIQFQNDINNFIKTYKILNEGNENTKDLFMKIVKELRSQYIDILIQFSNHSNISTTVDISKVKDDIKKKCYQIIKVFPSEKTNIVG